jgi:hypothetical protein
MLTHDAIDLHCREHQLSDLVDTMVAHLQQRQSTDAAFRDRLDVLETVTYRTVILHAGELRIERGSERTVPINPRDLETLFTAREKHPDRRPCRGLLAPAIRR